jgi:hypothetical protein
MTSTFYPQTHIFFLPLCLGAIGVEGGAGFLLATNHYRFSCNNVASLFVARRKQMQLHHQTTIIIPFLLRDGVACIEACRTCIVLASE